MVDRVVVRVPATVANLGPGFDCLGMAIAWYNEVRVERDPGGALTVTATGPGAESIAKDGTNLVVRGFEAATGASSGIRVHQIIGIAHGRGFGSSAAAICAGLVAGAAMDGGAADLLAKAVEIEGHADNVAPCLRGGITVSSAGRTIRLDPPPAVRPLVIVSPNRLGTDVARSVLGETVSRSDAAATAGRAALLAAALATGDVDALFEATADVFHQPARFDLMPESGELVASLRRERIAAFLSGAGPSVAALIPDGGSARAEDVARACAPDGWDVRVERFDVRGAVVVDQR